MNHSITALLVASAALTGCQYYVEPQTAPAADSYEYTAPETTYTAPPAAEQAGCYSTVVAPKGDLKTDIVGTWQDWQSGSDKVVRFVADGTVTLEAFPVDADGYADESKAATVEFRGTWVVDTGKLTITWDDGVVESGSTSVESIPNCVMLVMLVPEGKTSRIPNASELEQVTCIPPSAAVSTSSVVK